MIEDKEIVKQEINGDVIRKDTFTAEELLEEIRKEDPNFNFGEQEEPGNVFRMYPEPDVNFYVPLSIQELKASPPKPLEFVFKPCLPEQGICFIYAKTGLGKTLFTLNLAYAIAQGGRFLRYWCEKPRKVLYLDGEMPYGQIYSRIMQIEKQQGALDFPDNFKLLTQDKLLPHRLPPIDDEIGQEIYTNILEKYNFEVLIIDNLSMLSSFDENKSNEWKPIQNWLVYLRSIGKSIIIIHHAGKNDDYRGTSRMLDCADVAIGLQPIADDNLESDFVKSKRFKIVYRKARLCGGQDILPFEVDLTDQIWSTKSIEQTEIDRVVDMYNMKMSTRAMAIELGCGQSKACKLVRKAKDLKLIRD